MALLPCTDSNSAIYFYEKVKVERGKNNGVKKKRKKNKKTEFLGKEFQK